ncbi:hypothetical protein [Maritimibacter sp. UBA3975]|uniref:hypothetical protein n=1 Tax=Maritimibacter sp. UBA3975 TaxID=1946833 RepID=UPI000C09E0F1|nr:hypothetical protein [Maritimibacter sp. UBA3975]MAM62114.1 hypothetical protein [Maritimibacter sp.]|tara:strand:- start:14510 stop:14902 length:393 start_codon:yes stop_codon:yes gene_type:complete
MTETAVATFTGNRATYIKEHVMLAAIGSVLAVALLMALGNEHAWTGVVGAVAAIAVRGVYVASEQIGQDWTLTRSELISPAGVRVPRADIVKVRTIFSAAQVITRSGDKYMIKYQADPAATAATIRGEAA